LCRQYTSFEAGLATFSHRHRNVQFHVRLHCQIRRKSRDIYLTLRTSNKSSSALRGHKKMSATLDTATGPATGSATGSATGGLLVNQSIDGHKILVIGQTSLTSGRIEKLNALGAATELVSEQQILDDPHLTILTNRGRPEVDYVVDGVYITVPKQSLDIARRIADKCRRLRIPVNVADHPDLCTFTLLSCYSDGSFQLGITTGGKGCRLASRIKRHVVNSLPSQLGEICQRVGALRKAVQNDDQDTDNHDDDAEQSSGFNSLVLEKSEEKQKQRIRWLCQIVEYYPFSKLASLEIDALSNDYRHVILSSDVPSEQSGRISLVGAGPGSEELLTKAALNEIHSADIILADKLVPSQVLALVPRRTPVHIAKKFPGNADRAQQELLELGLESLKQGKRVVRLKQGDPYIFGRGAEEYVFFRDHGYVPKVVAGVTSALAAPLYANISATHRDVADQLLVCTGTGRGGKLPDFPDWVASRTTVFLMSLHRIDEVVEALVTEKHWDENVPCAVVERASCPDQRIIRTRLKHVAEAIKVNGSRPPGLLVTGYACEVIQSEPHEKWTVTDGYPLIE
jgi:uroporphyrin-III C-methyltransferase